MTDDPCPKCNGSGKTTQLNFTKARTEKVVCDACHGSGQRQVDPKDMGDGMRMALVHCQVVLYQWFIDKKPVATLELRVFPLLEADGKPKTIGNIAMLYAEIPRMYTNTKHRKKGYMGQLINAARMSPKITRLETSWNDSTADGRNILIAHGFKQDGDILLWRQGMDKEA